VKSGGVVAGLRRVTSLNSYRRLPFWYASRPGSWDRAALSARALKYCWIDGEEVARLEAAAADADLGLDVLRNVACPWLAAHTHW